MLGAGLSSEHVFLREPSHAHKTGMRIIISIFTGEKTEIRINSGAS